MKYLLTLLLLLPAVANADTDWGATFPPERVSSHLPPGPPPAVMVAASGADVEALLARTAFATSLRATGRTRVTLDANLLGDMSSLDDGEIVKRAAAQPIDWIAVVRAFPGEGNRYTAVVTFYD